MKNGLLQRMRAGGCDIRWNDGSKISNTMDAHRVLSYTAQHYGLGTQNAVQESLFEAYFRDGLDIGDRKLLVEKAAAHGVDAEKLGFFLETDEGKEEVSHGDRTAKRGKNISGVPYFEIEGYSRNGFSGAQDPSLFEAVFGKMLGEGSNM
eukprot:NODE_603_length_1334_cov_66.913836_g564_i0.p1 GENE.NODE_603_length_1334_cov_66.913836_g564_i0~~NODE_603_length_1334_cov_66.913836_g564_i0.p1  ORF type:complete len:150 (-),score=21.31 NODE_603_length_1334_cov_66.913836_g564_i0:572-1021(-)